MRRRLRQHFGTCTNHRGNLRRLDRGLRQGESEPAPQAGRLLPLNGLLEILFAESEHALLNQIAALCPGKMTYMIKTDEHLGQELKMNVAFYE